jgi:Domain of unknown function (DUF6468)
VSGWQLLLELALVGMLAATLFHALRLERALGVLKQDRAALEELVAGFNASFRQAEVGIDQLRSTANGAGRQVARQVETGRAVQADLAFLVERGERAADRLEQLVRAARPRLQEPPREPETTASEPRLRSQAERDLLKALKLAR